jgi:CBS domain-containing protein
MAYGHSARFVDLAAADRTETSEFAAPPPPAAGGGISSHYRRTSTTPPINPRANNQTLQGGGNRGSVETALLLPSQFRSIASLAEHSAENDVPNPEDNNSAFCALTDFRREYPAAVNADSSLDDALADMIRLGVHTLVVIQQRIESVDPYLVGLITAHDIERERPHRLRRTTRLNWPEDAIVADVVTPWDELPLVNYESLRTMSADDLNEIFQSASLTHLLVIEMQGAESMLARGLLSRAALAEWRIPERIARERILARRSNATPYQKTTGVQREVFQSDHRNCDEAQSSRRPSPTFASARKLSERDAAGICTGGGKRCSGADDDADRSSGAGGRESDLARHHPLRDHRRGRAV